MVEGKQPTNVVAKISVALVNFEPQSALSQPSHGHMVKGKTQVRHKNTHIHTGTHTHAAEIVESTSVNRF